MPAPSEVRTLVGRFAESRASYVSGRYNETQTRIEFVDPATATTTHEETLLQRRIVATDHQIDRLVYDLYGLTEEEIAIVQGEGDERSERTRS